VTKKIIICCDGTGNEIKENQSNVLKFYRLLKKSESQIAFYDPGVGTISNSGAWAAFKSKFRGVLGLATGYGLDGNVLDAYHFLISQYEEGDDVYLFGFSRGAYTVRVLAGLINMVGVLYPHQTNLSGYALTAYKQARTEDQFDTAWRVQEVLDSRRITIRFIGCWDTVASVIVPRPDRFYLPGLEPLSFTDRNPCVQVFRHAISIDERRRMFRLARWQDPQLFKVNPFVPDEDADPQNIRQVWFSGVHSDIGGGYPEQQSGAAKYPLAWMVEQAQEHGLEFRARLVKRLVYGKNPSNVVEGSKRDYAAPEPTAQLHNSMTGAWKLLEYLPKRRKYSSDPALRQDSGLYLPMSEWRYIPPDADIHSSVWDRVRLTANSGPDKYQPSNLPERK